MMAGPNKDAMILGRVRAPRLSCQQFGVLMKFMKAHPNFAAGRAGGSPGLTTREEHELWWQQLTAQLNNTVGPSKSTHKWQKCWVDLKSNARSRAAKIRAAISNPGLDAVTPTLTQWDHQVLSLMGPAYTDIHALYEHRRDHSASDINENNSNSSYQDQDLGYQHYENSPQQFSENSLASHEENGHLTATSNAIVNNVKLEAEEEDHAELVFEEVECDVEDDTDLREDVEPAQYNPLENGVLPRFSQTLSPSVTVSPVTVPGNRQGNISLVSSSTTLPHRQIPVLSVTQSTRKRKLVDVQDEDDDTYEKVPRGTVSILERLAKAAEESNNIQRQALNALNRLNNTFSQFVPLLKQFSSNSSISNRKS